MNIYVGNLSKDVTEDELRAAFESFGQIIFVRIIKDKYTDESRGFGFIEMPAKQEAILAIENLNGTELKEKTIVVNEARSRLDVSRNGGGQRKSSWLNRF